MCARQLRKHGVKVKLHGQPFQILLLLLERPGEVVTREEMREKLWAGDTFVDFEHSLNTAIKKLRQALGDSAEEPRYIETLPRLGYRFIGEVAEAPAAEAAAEAAGPRLVTFSPTAARGQDATPSSALASFLSWFGYRPWRWILIAAAAAGLTAWATILILQVRGRPPRPARIMLAVLPFQNLTGDPNQDYFSDGLTEEMITDLGSLEPGRLGVIARTSVMQYKRSDKPVDQIGRELGVQYVLEGSVRRDADRVRIAAQLIQMKDQTHLWSRQYDRELRNLLALQGEIAQEVADEIQLTLGQDRKPAAAPPPHPAHSPQSYEAYDLYLKGRYFWNKRTKDGFQQAADYFQQSITKDPNYARAYAGLADTFALMSSWFLVPQNEFIPKARAAALRALQIDGGLAEAHTSLAVIAQNYDYDWQSAEKEYRVAIQLDPGYATAHQWYAECLSLQGRFGEALAESERARQLDPLSLIIATDHGAILYFSRQYDRAIEQFRTVQAMEPNFARTHMVTFAYVEKGMFAEALAEVGKWHHSDGTPVWEMEAYVYGRWGRQAQARRTLAKWEQWNRSRRSPTTSAVLAAYVAVGGKDDAIALLQKAYSEHSNAVVEIKVAPYCDPLRSDPRFQELLRRVGLPP